MHRFKRGRFAAVGSQRLSLRRPWLSGLTALVLACGGVGVTTSEALMLSSTVAEDNGTNSNGIDGNQNVYSTPVAGPGVLTAANGYDFTSTSYLALTTIDSITITLTMQDGNSDTGDFDFNHLHLALDGTDTGFLLNGFQGNGLQDTFTFTSTPFNANAILASLQADGKLNGTVTTDNANDTATSPNEIYFGNDQGTQMTTLSITGQVPEPGALALSGLGFLALAGLRRGRRASRGQAASR